ncbi:MAG TPA: Hint domain-containing protein, partial [Paracoccaceae bacterium]|nr:Hint domain-containing protein [Paracoccaceae bacterium]
LNVVNTSQAPTTLLTFTSGTSGDLKLDIAAGGGVDPDTWVIIGGQQYSFTVVFTGSLPQANKLSNVAGSDLRGDEVVVIDVNGTRYFFLKDGSGTLSVMNAFPNGALDIVGLSTSTPVLLCFGAGTRIATPHGPRAVEALRPGDGLSLADGGTGVLRWVGHRHLSVADLILHPRLRPVVIAAHAFGQGRPARDLTVSPQHRILVEGWQAELLFGADAVLVPALHLPAPLARRAEVTGPVDYYHLYLDDHAILLSEGLPSESFQPGAQGLTALDEGLRAELEALFPGTAGMARPDAAPSLRRHEARALMAMRGA